MSLYRQAGGSTRRNLAIAAIAALLVGALAGFIAGRSSAPEPTLEELAEEARAEADRAVSAIELVGIEYPEAVRGGEIVAETEYEAARSQAEIAASTLASASELRELDPEAMEVAEARVEEVVAGVEAVADPKELESTLLRARVALATLSGRPLAGEAKGAP